MPILNYNTTLQSNNTDLQAILDAVNNLPDVGSGSGEQATPVISINSANGIITATAGTKSSTYQLAFQPAKSITPSAASQIAVSSGYYTGGDVMVAGDSNLVASNIKNGVSIFGVSGTLENGGAAEWSENEDAIISKTISSYMNDRVTNIGSNAFAYCRSLTSVSFPVCTIIGSNAFKDCNNLTTASFPVCTNIGSYAFAYCSSLTTASFPVCTNIGSYAFSYCSSLTTVSFPVCTNIGGNAFKDCSSLTTVSFPVCTNIGSYAFSYCNNLTTASFPVCTNIGSNAFAYCRSLTSVSFPVCTTIGGDAFYKCSRLTSVSFPVCTSIGSNAFKDCYNLTSIYLTGSRVCKLSNSNAFSSTPIGGYSASAGTYGSIYVPASLLTSYQTATNWTYFSSRFVAYDNSSDSGDSGDSGLISFTIAGTSYKAEEGMTWAEWVNSKYNTLGFYDDGYDEIALDTGKPDPEYVYDQDWNCCTPSDLIIGDYNYILSV